MVLRPAGLTTRSARCFFPRSVLKDPKDASALLQRAGFTLLTVDVEDIAIGYPSMFELVEDLKDMGEGNAILGR